MSSSPLPRIGPLALSPLLLLLACAGADDPCDSLCGVALESYVSCQDEWNLAWGDPESRWSSADDHANWCTTWADERRLLARTAEDPDAEATLLSRCEEQGEALQNGGCDAYWASLLD